MFLTQVEVDLQNRQKIKDLSHLGAYHNWVERSFPDEINRQMRLRKLWRLDSINGKQYLLIVSQNQPNLHLLEYYGVEDSAKTKSYDGFLNRIQNGMRARFRVTLNPVISISQGAGKRGKVVPHVTVDQQKQFLLDRSKQNGFSLKPDEFSIVERGYTTFKKAGTKSIRLSKVSYEGMLTIVDSEQFFHTLTEGFGKKKAYGFGMMTIIPVSE